MQLKLHVLTLSHTGWEKNGEPKSWKLPSNEFLHNRKHRITEILDLCENKIFRGKEIYNQRIALKVAKDEATVNTV